MSSPGPPGCSREPARHRRPRRCPGGRDRNGLRRAGARPARGAHRRLVPDPAAVRRGPDPPGATGEPRRRPGSGRRHPGRPGVAGDHGRRDGDPVAGAAGLRPRPADRRRRVRRRLDHAGGGGLGRVAARHARRPHPRRGRPVLVTDPRVRPSTGTATSPRSAPRRRPAPGTATRGGSTRWDRCSSCPGTWADWATDGDGDGRRDPLDLDDAAAAAARYLCAGGHDLSSGSGWSAAVLTYNRARVYVDEVYAAAVAYTDAG